LSSAVSGRARPPDGFTVAGTGIPRRGCTSDRPWGATSRPRLGEGRTLSSRKKGLPPCVHSAACERHQDWGRPREGVQELVGAGRRHGSSRSCVCTSSAPAMLYCRPIVEPGAASELLTPVWCAHTAAECTHGRQPLLSGRERADPRRDGALVGTPGAYRLVQTLRGMPVPATVQGRPGGAHRPLTAGGQTLAPNCRRDWTDVPSPCCEPLLTCPRRHCTAAWRTSRRRVSCMRHACSPSKTTPSSMP